MEKLPKKWHVLPRNEEQNKAYIAYRGNDYFGEMHNVALNDIPIWVKRDDVDSDSVELTFHQFKSLVLGEEQLEYLTEKHYINNNKKAETMQNTESKVDKITAVITTDNKILIEQNGITIVNHPVAKETLTTRLVKLQSVSYDRKDKKKETPIVTTVEREVSVSVIAAENGDLYTGYSVKNPTDKNVSPEIGKTIARNRAINPKTNLTKGEGVTRDLVSKYVLKGVAADIFEKMSKGSVKLKGVK